MFVQTSKVSWVSKRDNLSLIGVPERGFCVLKHRYLPVYAGTWDDCFYIAQCIIAADDNRHVPIYLDSRYLPCSKAEAVYEIEYNGLFEEYRTLCNGVNVKSLHGIVQRILGGIFISDSPFRVLPETDKFTLGIFAEHLGQTMLITNTHGTHISYISVDETQ